MSRNILICWVGLLIATGPAWAQPSLRGETIVTGAIITLGDVIDGAGPAASVAIARSPEPGQERVFSAAHIYAVARAKGVALGPVSSIGSVVVRRGGKRIDTSEIKEAIRDALVEKAGVGDLRVDLANPNLAFHVLLETSNDLEVYGLAYDRRSGRFSATVVAAAGNRGATRLGVSGRAVRVMKIPVPAHRIDKGRIIAQEDLEWVEVRNDHVNAQTVTDLGGLVGMSPRIRLRAGRPIRAVDLRAPLVVEKGAPVTMVFRTRGMLLTAGGRAIDEGAMGDTVRVRNVKSQLVVDAVIIGSGVVTVRQNYLMAAEQ